MKKENKEQLSIRIRQPYKDYYKKNLSSDWLEDKIAEAMEPTPTEKDLFIAYAVNKGVHLGAQTIAALLELYEEEKYFFGWDTLVEIFKIAGQKINAASEEKEKQGKSLSNAEMKVIQKAVINDYKK